MCSIPGLGVDETFHCLPSSDDNQAYLSLLDSDDESPMAVSVSNSKHCRLKLKQEFADPSIECWEIPLPPATNDTPKLEVPERHQRGLPSPPASDPTSDMERMRSESVALITLVPQRPSAASREVVESSSAKRKAKGKPRQYRQWICL